MSKVLGIDLGGTGFKAGVVQNGQLIKQTRLAVHRAMTSDELFDVLFDLIDGFKDPEVIAAGVGVPGIVNPEEGSIHDIQNLPAWDEIYIKQILEDKYAIPFNINNDANCFTLAEHRFGKGQPYQNMVGLSIGTGLGMGLIIDGKLYNGLLCGAGEIGMLKYLDGILEEYCGSFFFTREFNSDGRALFEQAQKGDATALLAYHKFGKHMGEAVKAISYLYAPNAIVMGGSIAQAYSLFKPGMDQSLASFAYPKQIQQMKIHVSDLAHSAILGAAALSY